MAPPFKQAEFDIMFAEGISKMGELVDLGVEKRVLEKSGAWYSYKGERLGQGREQVRDFLKNNPAIARDIEQRVRESSGVGAKAPEKRADKEDKGDKKADARSEEKERRSHAVRG
jgi:recombination protein RecA